MALLNVVISAASGEISNKVKHSWPHFGREGHCLGYVCLGLSH